MHVKASSILWKHVRAACAYTYIVGVVRHFNIKILNEKEKISASLTIVLPAAVPVL